MEALSKFGWRSDGPVSIFEWLGMLATGYLTLKYVLMPLFGFLSKMFESSPKKVVVGLQREALEDVLVEGYERFDPKRLEEESRKPCEEQKVYKWDPSTLQYFGETPATTKDEVDQAVARARIAQDKWKQSSFKTRRLLMRTMLRYITENQELCARVAVRDSGKTFLDALIGEVLVTCEKLVWLTESGEKCLQPEERETGRMMMMKKVRVEFTPVGVVGAIVPWNYPFHNIFNPVSAALFSGNAIVIKVSEYASWSIETYKKIIDGCLDAVNAPRDLVQYVVGYGATGAALVKSGVDKIIFVGSPQVGAMVARDAAANLTPVVLELGGKDPFVVCDDANIDSIVQTACRGVWQNMGQNCAGPERFFVYEKVYTEFCDKVTSVVKQMKLGPSLGDPAVDCGSICMGPRQLLHYQRLVDDAVGKGAKVLAGGAIPDESSLTGTFYPPTVLVDVTEDAIIAQEEIFGPIMCVFKVVNNSDDEAVRMANNCDFALSSCAFSGSATRALAVASRLHAGMSAVNDLEGCTYMSQSLPFGGHKKSGYDRFAGPEGLRGLCNIRSVCEDRISFIRNSIPPPMAYPATGVGHHFAKGLIKMFYSTNILGNIDGLLKVAWYAIVEPKASKTG